ncbi:MAG TPA: VTT domain-containing protein, partial [Polyangia bacterium]
MARSPVVEVVAALIAGGVGLPIPEELALVTAGWFIARGEPAGPMCLGAIAAVLAGDLVMYVAGRSARLGLVRRLVGERHIVRLEGACARYGAKLLLVARFVPGLRGALLVAAGAGRVPLARFFAC